jgi:hypothetical protein
MGNFLQIASYPINSIIENHIFIYWQLCICSQLCSEVISGHREADKPCDSMFSRDLLCIKWHGREKSILAALRQALDCERFLITGSARRFNDSPTKVLTMSLANADNYTILYYWRTKKSRIRLIGRFFTFICNNDNYNNTEWTLIFNLIEYINKINLASNK